MFLVLVALIFGLTLPLFFLVRPVYDASATLLTDLIVMVSGKPIEVSSEADRLVFRSSARPRFEADFSTVSVTGNAPLLWALLLATPGMGLSRRLRVFLTGAGLLLATHALFFWVKIEIALVEGGHPLAGGGRLWSFLDDAFEISGRGFFPVAIWIPLTYQYLRGRVDDRSPIRSTAGRNRPCPCGSGRKRKHCCDRT